MSFALRKIEKKSTDWYVVELVNSAGDLIENVSINRISKKGDVFPNFDNLKQDTKIDGRLWESDSGKQYLFAPKGGAKATYKSSERADREYDKKFDKQLEELEYPVSEKIETLLNKFTGMQIDIQIIKELLQPKKKTSDIDYPMDELNPEDVPF